MIKLVIQISKGLVRDQRSRRMIMFYSVLGALLVLFIGAIVPLNWWRAHPLFFVAYWFACAWLTLLATLLAVFDLLLVRAAGRRARKDLEAQYLRGVVKESSNDTNPPRA